MSAARVVAALASDDAAELFLALASLPPEIEGSDLAALAAVANFGEDDAALDRLSRAEGAFITAFQLGMFDVVSARPDDARTSGTDSGYIPAIRNFAVNDRLEDILARGFPGVNDGDIVPDTATSRWAATLVAASRPGPVAHFSLRCAPADRPGPEDFAGLLATHADVDVRIASVSKIAALLPAPNCTRASGRRSSSSPRPICSCGPGRSRNGSAMGDPRTGSACRQTPTASWRPCAACAAPTSGAWPPTGRFRARSTGSLAASSDPAASIGPGASPSSDEWRPGSDVGARRRSSRLSPTRAAPAPWRAPRAAATATDLGLDAAAGFVAASFAGLWPLPAFKVAFGPRLFVAADDPDIGTRLLERAGHLARNGWRVLLHGAPGGGKSSFASELARRMADAYGFGPVTSVVTISSARFLGRACGETENILLEMWERADLVGGVLLVDELDSLCGRRDPTETGGNAHLVRSLTDKYLRNLDSFPSVPLVATVNAIATIDGAVRRRVVFEIPVLDDLPADRERVAWSSILGRFAPVGWRPVGASVSDIAIARARCRMLGLDDSASLAEAIARARTARRGEVRKSIGRSSVH